MAPSVLEYGGESKTICWYMQRRFTELDGEAAQLIKQYALLHEALAAPKRRKGTASEQTQETRR
jgi:hypothetical protein